jgi:SAM-dependent methyltransferase
MDNNYNTIYQESGERNFYESHYKTKGFKAMRPQWVYDRWLRLLGNLKKDEKLLDVACGTGFFLKAASQAGLQTVGLELADEAVALARMASPTSEVTQGFGEALPYGDNSFDYVTCLGSLEHFSNPQQGLAEMVRVAKDSARFLIILPNKNYWLWKYRLIPQGTKQRNFEVVKDLAGWKEFLTQAGLTILTVKQDKYPASETKIFSSLNIIKIIRRLAYRFIWIFIPLSFTYQFVFVLEKQNKRD